MDLLRSIIDKLTVREIGQNKGWELCFERNGRTVLSYRQDFPSAELAYGKLKELRKAYRAIRDTKVSPHPKLELLKSIEMAIAQAEKAE